MQVPVIPSPPRSAATVPHGAAAANGAGQANRLPALRRIQTQDLAPARSAPAETVTAQPAARHSGATTPFREPGLQQHLGGLQQALAYTEQLGRDLQELKSGLSRALARPQSTELQGLPAKLDAVGQSWAARAGDAAGRLDARLQPVGEGAGGDETARQRFRMRGLDLNTLATAGAETLRLSVPGQPRSIAVPLDGQGLQRALQSLQGALAPTDVRVETAGGELWFSIAEAQWPALRDGLSIKGDGKRFPSGQMVRALLDPQADALTPGSWRVDSGEAQRRSLVQVLDAQAQLGRAQQQLGQSLAKAAALPPTSAAANAIAMSDFAAGFAAEASVQALSYERLSALAPALLGLHRSQVQQLLLPPGAL